MWSCKHFSGAFTLAEVLITLGIIGIVASLTMPALIQHHKKTETSARLKKFYSMLSQAILLSEVDNGPALDWNYVSHVDSDNNPIPAADNQKATLAYFNRYFAKYFKYISVDENSDLADLEDNIKRYINVKLADSSSMYMKFGACADIRYDTNGDKGPNEYGKDIYVFLLCPRKYNQQFCLNQTKALCTYGFANDKDNAINACKNEATFCSRLLELDNWEFKNYYPFKL